MPLYKEVIINHTTTLYLWKITEDLEWFTDVVELNNSSQKRINSMKSESHQKGFLAVRMLLQHLGYNDFDLEYDAKGKPYLKDDKYISISHSHEFSAIAVSTHSIGIDLEMVKEKTLKIASRFMDVSHLENLSDIEKIQKATVIWGIKESIFKIKSIEGISFTNHIFEKKFNLEDKITKAQLRFNSEIENYNLVFNFIDNYIYVCAYIH
jgi:phosphopantetheinyl transferase